MDWTTGPCPVCPPKRKKPPDRDGTFCNFEDTAHRKPQYNDANVTSDWTCTEGHQSLSQASLRSGVCLPHPHTFPPSPNHKILVTIGTGYGRKSFFVRTMLSEEPTSLLGHGQESRPREYSTQSNGCDFSNYGYEGSSPSVMKTYETPHSSFRDEVKAFDGLASNDACYRDQLSDYLVHRFEKVIRGDYGQAPYPTGIPTGMKPSWDKLSRLYIASHFKEAREQKAQDLDGDLNTTTDKKTMLQEKLAMISLFLQRMATSTGTGLVASTMSSIAAIQPTLALVWHTLISPALTRSASSALPPRILRRFLDCGIAGSKCMNSLLEDPG